MIIDMTFAVSLSPILFVFINYADLTPVSPLQAALILTSALLTPPTPGPTALTSRPPAPTLWAAGPVHVKQVSGEMIRNLKATADRYIYRIWLP